MLTVLATLAAVSALACDESLQAAFKPDELTTVILVKPFKKGDPLVVKEPATDRTMRSPNDLCLVKLVVGPGNPGPADAPSTSPGIGIEVWLPAPANWNERVHAMGGGGFVGGPASSPDAIAWVYATFIAGREGAVSSFTDAGHSATDGSWGMNPDGTLAKDLWVDYAGRAIHEQAVKTKALAAAYYGRPVKFSYFDGASTGGRQGYKLAQDYPDDYDGIVANLPAMNWAQWTTAGLYRSLVVERDLGGKSLTDEQLDLVSNAAIHACDVVGGQHLGYIMDNAACRYDPTKDANVLCKSDGGKNTTAACVSESQANVVNKMWYGPTTDGSVPSPALDNGVAAKLAGKRLWYGLARGTSLYNAYFTRGAGAQAVGLPKGSGVGYLADQVALQLQNPTISEPSFLNASGNGEGLWRDLTYKQFANAFNRGIALDSAFGRLATDNPDLSVFKARGGRLLSWHGWNDEAIPVQGTIQYYDRVIAKMGGPATVQSFFKLYLVPGGGHMSPHGTSNPQANPPALAGQLYQAIVNWVEKGIAPDRIEIESPTVTPVKRSAPICPYPQHATYVSGDPNVAASFKCP